VNTDLGIRLGIRIDDFSQVYAILMGYITHIRFLSPHQFSRFDAAFSHQDLRLLTWSCCVTSDAMLPDFSFDTQRPFA